MPPKKIILLLFFFTTNFFCLLTQDFIKLDIKFSNLEEELNKKIEYENLLNSKQELEIQLNKIYSQLHDYGYLEIKKDSCKYDSLNIKCTLIPGKQYRYFIKKGNLGEEPLANIPADKFFNGNGILPLEYDYLTKSILTFFQNRGYPFANITLDNLEVRHDSIIGDIKIDHSHHILFDELKIEGDVNISRRFLSAHTGIIPEESYSEEKLNNLEQRLNSLDFISVEKKPEVVFTKEYAEVSVGLRKRNANRFDGIAGVVYDEQAENSMRFTGQINLFLINTLERAEWINMKWQGLGHGSQTLDISAGYPYLFYTPFSAEMKFLMRKQDSTYLQIQRTPAIEYRFSNNINAKIFVDWKTSELLDIEKYRDATQLPQVIDYTAVLYGVGLSYRSELFNIDPRTGYNYSFQFSLGNRTIEKNNHLPSELYDNIDLTSMQYTGQLLLKRLFPFANRSALLLRGEGGFTISENYFENELFRIGGLNSLRGFDEESLLASSYGSLLTEYRFITGRNSYLSLFANAGIIERKISDSYSLKIPVGAGAGISQELPAGIFSLYFALGKTTDQSVNFNDIKVHVGFVNTF